MTISKFSICLGIVFGATCIGGTNQVWAALRSARSTAVTPTDLSAAYNPNPMKDDIILPMPEGYSMVFRAVSIPAKNILFDRKFLMGLSNNDALRSVYERRVDGYINAPFERADLPKQWNAKLPKEETSGYFYYFIGKYEISQGQWNAVMGGKKPERPELPQANITWYDLQAFLQKYNEWLMKNHLSELPMSEDMPGFLRLPTEEEWEFAARGGNLPPEKMNFQDFPLEDGKKLVDYGVYGSNYENALPIGKKRPNCLGLYDTVGNLAEIVQSQFRFTVSEYANKQVNRRLHGAQGGFLSKGGSFLSQNDSDVLPGKRNELRMFVKGDGNKFVPFKARYVGSRLVIATINVPGAKRQQEIELALNQRVNEPKPEAVNPPGKTRATNKSAAVALPQIAVPKVVSDKKVTPALWGNGEEKVRIVQIDRNGRLTTELDKVIKSTNSPIMQSNLYQLRDLIEDNNAALERERDANLLNALRSAAYEAVSLRALGYRIWVVNDEWKKLAQKYGTSPYGRESLKKTKKIIGEFFDQLRNTTNFYLISLEEIAQIPSQDISQKILFLKNEYKGSDKFSSRMRDTIIASEKHIAIVKKSGLAGLKENKVWEDVMDERIYEVVKKWMKTK